MIADEREFKHREISKKIIGVFYDVYNELGHGFIESVYHKSMVIALNAAGVQVCSPVIKHRRKHHDEKADAYFHTEMMGSSSLQRVITQVTNGTKAQRKVTT